MRHAAKQSEWRTILKVVEDTQAFSLTASKRIWLTLRTICLGLAALSCAFIQP